MTTPNQSPPDRDPVTQEERDSAKRLRDNVNLHVHALLAETGDRDRPPFCAIHLRDGSSPDNHTLYDSRRDLFRHHPHDNYVIAVKIGRDTMSEEEALVVLMFSRMALKRGVVFREEEPVVPHRLELLKGFNNRTLKGLLNGRG